jgi:hypothetical protein
LANLTNGQKTSSANLQSTAVTQAEAATLQRSAVAAELANMRLGDNQHGGSANLQTQVSQTEAATLLNVSPRAVAAELANIKLGDFVGNQHVGYANLHTPVSQTEAAAAFRHGVAG